MTADPHTLDKPEEVDQNYTHRQVLEVLTGLLIALFVSALSATVVATALPTIVGELGGQDQLAWVISATLLANTASVPLWGKMSDLYGRKPLFMLAILVFVVASALAGLSQNMTHLIGARALQGIGAGGIIALSQAIMADIVEPRERGRYTGYLGSSFALATLAGPLIGGFLVDSGDTGWRWCFYISVPVALVALLVVHRTLHLPHQHREAKVDYWGAATITGGVVALLLVLSLGGKQFAWMSSWTALLTAVAVLLIGAAVLIERRVAEPVLPPRLFGNRTVVLANVANFMTGMVMFGSVSYLPLYLQIVKGESATVSGMLILPLMFGLLVASTASGRAITRLGRWKVFPIVGMLAMAAGVFLLSLVHVDTALAYTGVFMAVLGLGIGLTFQVLILAVQNSVPRRDMGAATSAATFFRIMGGAVGVAVFGAILNNRLSATLPDLFAQRHVTPPPGSLEDVSGLLGSPRELATLPGPVLDVIRESFTQALHWVFLVGVPLCLAGWVAVAFIREIPLRSGARPTSDKVAETAEPDPATPAPRVTSAAQITSDVR